MEVERLVSAADGSESFMVTFEPAEVEILHEIKGDNGLDTLEQTLKLTIEVGIGA
jgi:hypothetical protein